MAITVNEFDAREAELNAQKRKAYYSNYSEKMKEEWKKKTILSIRIRHEDTEMMEFYSWLMEHYPTKRKNGTVDMDAFIRSVKGRIMEGN